MSRLQIKQITLLSLLLVLTLTTFGQNVDSLKQEIHLCETDTCKNKLAHAIAKIYLSNNLDSAEHYSIMSSELAQRTQWHKALILSYFLQVSILSQKKDFSQCNRIYDKMYDAIKGTEFEEKYLPFYYGSRGVYYQRRNIPDSATLVYERALQDLDPNQKDYYTVKNGILANLGKIEKGKGKFYKALQHFEKAQDNLEKDSFTYKQKYQVFYDIGLLYKRLGNYQTSRNFFEKATKNLGTLPDSKVKVYRDLAEVYTLQKDTAAVMMMLDTLTQLYPKVSSRNKCKFDYTLVQMYLFLNDKTAAQKYASSLDECFEKKYINGMDYNFVKAQGYALNEKYDQAIQHYKETLVQYKKSERNVKKYEAEAVEQILLNSLKVATPRDSLLAYFTEYRMLRNSVQEIIVGQEVEKWNAQYQNRIKQDSINILQLQSDNQQASLAKRNIWMILAGITLFLLSLLLGLSRKFAKTQKQLNSLLEKEKEQLVFENKELEEINQNLQEKIENLSIEKKTRSLPFKKLELKGTNKVHLIVFDNITHIVAEDDGSRVFTEKNSVWSPTTLKDLTSQLPDNSFLRIFRSTIINMYYVDWVNTSTLRMKDGTELKIGRTYKSEIVRRFKKQA